MHQRTPRPAQSNGPVGATPSCLQRRCLALLGRSFILAGSLLAGLVIHLLGQGPGAAAHDVAHGDSVAAGAIAVGHPGQQATGNAHRVDVGSGRHLDTRVEMSAQPGADGHDDACADARRADGPGAPTLIPPAPVSESARDVRAASASCAAGLAQPRAPDPVRALGVQRT